MKISADNIKKVRGLYRGAFLTKEISEHIKKRKEYAVKTAWECGILLAETEIALLNAHNEVEQLRKELDKVSSDGK